MSAHEPAPDLPGPWPDVLAAYADGELDPCARATVERWLACHPAAREELRTQLQLSPENWPLWQLAEPPLPTDDAWAAVQEAVAAGVTSEPVASPVQPVASAPAAWSRRRVRRWGGVGVAAAVAAVVVASVLAPPGPIPDAPPVVESAAADDPLAGYAVLPVVAAEDVDVHRVAGSGGGWLPVGDHPLGGALVLAGEDDVELEGADPHPAWPAGGPQITRGPGDAAMIFAAGPR